MSTDELTHGHYSFDGYVTTKIVHSKTEHEWHMKLLAGDKESATTKALDYPLGVEVWNLKSPSYNGEIKLSLDVCDDETQYNCRNGMCVPLTER